MIRTKNGFIDHMYSCIVNLGNRDIYIKQHLNKYTVYYKDYPIAFFNSERLYIKSMDRRGELQGVIYQYRQRNTISSTTQEMAYIGVSETQSGLYCLIPKEERDNPRQVARLIINVIETVNKINMYGDVDKKTINMLPNIDKNIVKMLSELGIILYEDLRILGAKTIFLILIKNYEEPPVSTLLKLEAAIQNIPVNYLDMASTNALTLWWKKIKELIE